MDDKGEVNSSPANPQDEIPSTKSNQQETAANHNGVITGNVLNQSPLLTSVNDAQALLWYATREGKALPNDKVKIIVEADVLLKGGKRDANVESEFWSAYRDLAAAMQPVSVNSIRATYGYPFGDNHKKHNGLGNAITTKRNYSVSALLVLLLIIGMQIYWYIGTTFRTDLEAHREELDRISGALRDMSIRSASLTDNIKSVLESIKTTSGIKADILTKDIASMSAYRDEAHQVDIDFFNNIRRLDRLNVILSGDECLLQWWDLMTPHFLKKAETGPDLTAAAGSAGEQFSNFDPCEPQLNSRAASSAMEGLWIQRPVEFNIWPVGEGEWGGIVFSSQSYQEIILGIFNKLEGNQKQVELSLEGSKSMLAILTQYVLPLLYGTLGALAYTLRSLSIEIQKVTFTRGSDIRYSLRWPLGMLAGVTVGLFFDPTKLSGLAAISPLGLAFLAGYGVELVFTGLDRLVRAFAAGDGDPPKAAAG